MSMVVNIGGAEYQTHLVSAERNVNLCNTVCEATLVFEPGVPTFNPWTTVDVRLDGARWFAGRVIEARRSRGGSGGYSVICEHEALKRLKDYWIIGDYVVGMEWNTGACIGNICGRAGASVTLGGFVNETLPPNTWNNTNAFQILMELVTMGGAHIVPKEDGSLYVGVIGVDRGVYSDSYPYVTSCERIIDDRYFRTEAVVIGLGDVYEIATGSNPYGYDRAAIVANPLIQTTGAAYNVATHMIAEFNQNLDTERVTIAQRHVFSPGTTLRIYDQHDTRERLGVITEVQDHFSSKEMVSDVTIDQRCPNIYGWGITIPPTLYPALAIGNTQGFWVCPDIGPAFFGASGSTGFNDGFPTEWYSFSEGLPGGFGYFPNLSAQQYDTYGGRWVIRDPFSEDGRGVFALLPEYGLYYSPDVLPPPGVTSGSWAWTPWTKLLSNIIPLTRKDYQDDFYGFYWYDTYDFHITGMFPVEGESAVYALVEPYNPYAPFQPYLFGYIYKIQSNGTYTKLQTFPKPQYTGSYYRWSAGWYKAMCRASTPDLHHYMSAILPTGQRYSLAKTPLGNTAELAVYPTAQNNQAGFTDVYEVNGVRYGWHTDFVPNVGFTAWLQKVDDPTNTHVTPSDEDGTYRFDEWSFALDLTYGHAFCFGWVNTGLGTYKQAIFRTDDNGQSWTRVAKFDVPVAFDYRFTRLAGRTVYKGTWLEDLPVISAFRPADNLLYVSVDYGDHFYSTGPIPPWTSPVSCVLEMNR